MAATPTLNERASRLADHLVATAAALRITSQTSAAGARILDCGVKAEGGLQAGLALARVCLAGLAEVTLVPGEVAGVPCPLVQVMTDASGAGVHGLAVRRLADRCRQVFRHGLGADARGLRQGGAVRPHSRPRTAARAPSACWRRASCPTTTLSLTWASSLKLPANKLTLLAAPAASIAGNLQVVARSLETALHKLHELKFDLAQVVAGFGTAPLPPVAADELSAIGRTNDAILYGGRVVALGAGPTTSSWPRSGRRCRRPHRRTTGRRSPRSSSATSSDFYKIDPLLFSPAVIVFQNLKSGRATSSAGWSRRC